MYQLYFGKLLLPVPPEEIKLKIKNQNKTLSLINEGELNVLKSPGLTEVNMKLLLPAIKYHFATYTGGKFQGPTYYLSALEKLKTGRTVFDFSLIRGKETEKKDINMRATLEEYSIRESAEDMGDMWIDLELKQYMVFGTKVVKIKNNTASKPSGGSKKPGSPKLPADYIIKQGDNLPYIAQAFYGSQKDWMKIYKANKTVLDEVAASYDYKPEKGYRWIFPGTKITIPKL